MRELIIIETEEYGCYAGYKDENLTINKIFEWLDDIGFVIFNQINGQTTRIYLDETIIDILEDEFDVR